MQMIKYTGLYELNLGRLLGYYFLEGKLLQLGFRIRKEL